MESLATILLDEIAVEGRNGCSLCHLYGIYEKYHASSLAQPLTHNLKLYICKQLLNMPGISIKLRGNGNGILSQEKRQQLRSELNLQWLQDHEKKIYLIASDHNITRIVSNNFYITSLADATLSALEEVAKSRFEGSLQANISKNMGIDPKSVFYHLKGHIANNLIHPTSVIAHKVTTNLLIHRRFIFIRDDLDGPVLLNSQVKCDYLQIRRDISAILSQHTNQTLTSTDLFNLLIEKGYSINRHYYKSMIHRLSDEGYVEKLLVKQDDRGHLFCIRQVKEFDKEKIYEKHVITPMCQKLGFRTDVSLMQQVYMLIAASGNTGITSSEIRYHLNNARPKELGNVLGWLESKKVKTKISKTYECIGRSRSYRYFARNPPSVLAEDIAQIHQMLENSSENIVAEPQPSNLAVINDKQFNSHFEVRKHNILLLVKQNEIIENSIKFRELYMERYKPTHLIDRKSIMRAAKDLQSEGKMNILVIDIGMFGYFESKSLFTIPEYTEEHEKVQSFIKEIQDRVLKPRVIVPRDLVVVDMEIERYYKESLRFSRKGKTKRAKGKKKDEFSDDSSKSISEEEESVEAVTTDSDQVMEETEDWAPRLRERKSLNFTKESEISMILNRYDLVWMRPRFIRAKLFHQFLLEYCKALGSNTFQASKIFRDVPLRIYLTCIGHKITDGYPNLAEYLVEGGSFLIPICKLPLPVAKEIYAIGVANFRSRLIFLLSTLVDLKIVTPVDDKYDFANNQSALAASYKLAKQVELWNVFKGSLEGIFSIETPEQIEVYWNNLQLNSVSDMSVSRIEIADIHCNFRHLFYTVFPSNWIVKFVINEMHRKILDSYVTDKPSLITPLGNQDQITSIAKEAQIEPRCVSDYYRRLLIQAGISWREALKPKKEKKENSKRTVLQYLVKSRTRKAPKKAETSGEPEDELSLQKKKDEEKIRKEKRYLELRQRLDIKSTSQRASLLLEAQLAEIESTSRNNENQLVSNNSIKPSRSLRDYKFIPEEYEYLTLAYAILKTYQASAIVDFGISWVRINYEVLIPKFGAESRKPEIILRKRILSLLRYESVRKKVSIIGGVWSNLRKAAVNDAILPPSSDHANLLAEVEFLKSCNLSYVKDSAEVKEIPAGNLEPLPSSVSEIHEKFKVVDMDYYDLNQQLTRSPNLSSSRTLAAVFINECLSCVSTKTESDLDPSSEGTDELSEYDRACAYIKILLLMFETGEKSELAYSKLKEIQDEILRKAVAHLRNLGIAVDYKCYGILKKLPGLSIQLSRKASDVLVEDHTSIGLSNTSRKFLVDRVDILEQECSNNDMVSLLLFFFTQNVSIDISYTCPESTVLSRKEIENRGNDGLLIRTLSAFPKDANLIVRHDRDDELDVKEEEAHIKIMQILKDREVSTQELLSLASFNTKKLLNKILCNSKVHSFGYNSYRWRFTDDKLSDCDELSMAPRIWISFEGKYNKTMFELCKRLLLAEIFKHPGQSFMALSKRFYSLFSNCELADILGSLESDGFVDRRVLFSNDEMRLVSLVDIWRTSSAGWITTFYANCTNIAKGNQQLGFLYPPLV